MGSSPHSPSGPNKAGTRSLSSTTVVAALPPEPHTTALTSEPYFLDSAPGIFEYHSRGELSRPERSRRTQTFYLDDKHDDEHRVTIFEDVGVTFVKAEHGDTVQSLREKLVGISSQAGSPDFSYLGSESHRKIKSFNVTDSAIAAGIAQGTMWVPIPHPQSDRIMTNEQFVAYAKQAIADLQRADSPYGAQLRQTLSKVKEQDLISFLGALAMRESGGQPLGQFVYCRWEPQKLAHSYSMFHVLMEKDFASHEDGPGLRARRKLGLTEGQLYHPYNAVKLCLGFIYEKGGRPENFLPLSDKSAGQLARFYNGSAWRSMNPTYDQDIQTYFSQARAKFFHSASQPQAATRVASHTDKSVPPAAPSEHAALPPRTTAALLGDEAARGSAMRTEQIGARTLIQALGDIGARTGIFSIVDSSDVESFSANAGREVVRYLLKTYHNPRYEPADKIAVGKDEKGDFIAYQRGSRDSGKLYLASGEPSTPADFTDVVFRYIKPNATVLEDRQATGQTNQNSLVWLTAPVAVTLKTLPETLNRFNDACQKVNGAPFYGHESTTRGFVSAVDNFLAGIVNPESYQLRIALGFQQLRGADGKNYLEPRMRILATPKSGAAVGTQPFDMILTPRKTV